mmetsp:Transcript_79522/g.92964  ORF Transcript_79522/g.92964 Transcript_79522/m.92964 type:complete len:107 (+) Transcript_79522:53-373(+)
MGQADICMIISAAGFIYLLLIAILISSDSVSVEHMEPADGSSAAFYLAAFVYLIIFGVLFYSKYGTKAKQESIQKFINRAERKNQGYVQLADMSANTAARKPQETL